MHIFITFRGDEIRLDVSRTTTIINIKHEISQKINISTEQQKLLFLGNSLKNIRSLAYYNIQSADCLILHRQATSRQFWTSIVYFGAFIGLGLFMASPGPILNNLQFQTNVSLGIISIVFAFRAAGYIIGSLIFGLIADTYDAYFKKYHQFTSPIWPLRPHIIFGLCIIIPSLLMCCVVYINDIITLAIIISITGICFGGIDCLGNVLLLALFDTDNERDDLVAPYMQFLHFSFAVGAMLSPLIIELSFKLLTDQYDAAFWIMAAESIVFGSAILFIETPTRFYTDSNTNTSGSTVTTVTTGVASSSGSASSSSINNKHLNTYGSMDTTDDSKSNNTSSQGSSSNKSKSSSYKSKKRLFSIIMVASCAIFLGIYVGSEVSYGAYITTYCIDYLDTTPSVGRYFNSWYWFGLAFGRLSAVYFAKKYKPVHMLTGDLIGCLVVASLLYLFKDILLIVWLVSLLYGFFMASIFPCVFLIAEKTVQVKGKQAAIMIFGASCGECIIPTSEGVIMYMFGREYFAACTLILVLILLCVMIILLFQRGKITSLEIEHKIVVQ